MTVAFTELHDNHKEVRSNIGGDETQRAFVYLWYDAPNKKYYLVKDKGTPDDSYTHSSTIWEHFTKDNIPEGVTRHTCIWYE